MSSIGKSLGTTRKPMLFLPLGIVSLVAWLLIPVIGLSARAWTCRSAPKELKEGVAYSNTDYSCTTSGAGDADRGLFLLSLIAMPIIPLGSWLVWLGVSREYMVAQRGVTSLVKAISFITILYAAGLAFLAGWSGLAALINSTQTINGGLTSDFWVPLVLAVLLSSMTWVTYRYAQKTREIVKNSRRQGEAL